MHLTIGNKLYASWSLRPWLMMTAAGIELRETTAGVVPAMVGEGAVSSRRCPAPERATGWFQAQVVGGRLCPARDAVILPSSYSTSTAMETTRLSSKGQIVIPKSIRDASDWTEGTEFTIARTASGGLLLEPVRPAGTRSAADVFGCLRRQRRPVSIEEMDAAVAAQARRASGRRG